MVKAVPVPPLWGQFCSWKNTPGLDEQAGPGETCSSRDSKQGPESFLLLVTGGLQSSEKDWLCHRPSLLPLPTFCVES